MVFSTVLQSGPLKYFLRQFSNVDDASQFDVVTKPLAEYRLKKIEVKRSTTIDQISFTYDDETVWYSGHDSGKTDKRVVIMTDGEYLTRVTHEQFLNNKCAGAAVEFETNRGRVFSYQPVALTTNLRSEKRTIHALAGHEIISLNIKHGVLMGSEQQKCQDENKNSTEDWYVIGKFNEKEDEDENVFYQHFDSKSTAMLAWKDVIKNASLKDGRSAVMFDCKKLTVLKEHGKKKNILEIKSNATEKGFVAIKRSEDLSISDVFFRLFLLLQDKGDVKTMILLLFCAFLQSLIDAEAFVLSGKIVVLAISNETTLKENWYVNTTCNHLWNCSSQTDYLNILVLVYFLINFMKPVLRVFEKVVTHSSFEIKDIKMQEKSLNQVLSLDQSYFDTHTASDMRSIDSGIILFYLRRLLPVTFTSISKMAASIVYLCRIDMYLGLSAITLIIIAKYFILNPLEKMENKIYKLKYKLSLNSRQITNDVLSMFTTVKLFSHEDYHKKELADTQKRTFNLHSKLLFHRSLREIIGVGSRHFLFAILLYLAVQLLNVTRISHADFAAFMLLIKLFQGEFQTFVSIFDYMRRQHGQIESFLTLMDAEPGLQDGNTKLDEITSDIQFENVSFAYPSRPGEMVLNNLDLTIKMNKMTAIVGDSGAGKSTISKLLMRLYDPLSGCIKINEKNLQSYKLSDLHQDIAIVSQNPDLFDMSLADNISYGSSTGCCTEDEMKEAARRANCNEFITKFRGGFDVFASSRGSHLSGGQKQRIAIARAILRNPKVLILDEATSSLDAENEKQVQEALESLMKDRTIIVIAHRLSTIKNADEILCMKNGQIVEKGTHDDLIKKEGVYYNLVQKQITEI